jgi:hypothetical protein
MNQYFVFAFWNEYEKIDGGVSDFDSTHATEEEAIDHVETLTFTYAQVAFFDGKTLKPLWKADGWGCDDRGRRTPRFKWTWEQCK